MSPLLTDACEYPWRGQQRVKRVVIGGLLFLSYGLIIPGVVLTGYQTVIFRQVCADDTEAPPGFDDWRQLLVEGLVSWAILFLYAAAFLVLFGLFAAVIFSLGGAIGASSGTFAIGGGVVALVLSLVGFGIVLAILYLIPAAQAAYAVTGDFSSAFSPSTLRTVAVTKSYLIGVLVAILIYVMTLVSVNVLFITIVGTLLSPFILFYGYVAGYYAIGAGVAGTSLVTEPPELEAIDGEPRSE